MKIYDSNFVENKGVLIFGENCDMLITHTRFMNNIYYSTAVVHVADANIVINHSTFTNNTGIILSVVNTSMSISHSESINNQNEDAAVHVLNGTITSVDHSKFINNIGFSILYLENTDMTTLHLNE